jgi:hypothetical protein
VSLNKLHVRNLCFMRVVVHCHVLKSPSLNPLLNEFNPCEISVLTAESMKMTGFGLVPCIHLRLLYLDTYTRIYIILL